ncbi:MAG: ATP-binding protein [Candidatus Devosia phytovorans]|uniref:histidine kinase n=1 Tax=Candidatus Devosia phytovorans TaxID=3121372 RepID=A0AAJ5VY99_9HYPH|nr:ATP-binding protein [Devosia sp.]WEK06657.1 MAG: ATP-binding protein [Devosia sp.]
MTRLQIRIAGILIGAICLVVAVASLVTFVAISYPAPDRMAGPVAFQIRALYGAANIGPGSFPHLTADQVARLGEPVEDLTRAITSRLQSDDISVPVAVYHDKTADTPVAVLQMAGEYIAIDFPHDTLPPIDFWLIMGAWMGLIVVGVILVSLIMSYRVTRPFAVLEQALVTIGPDGVLPPLPETGSHETIETARMLNRLSSRLRGAMESRMRLVAAAGHDFRTPMTRMRLRAEFLDDDDRAAWLRDVDELERIADSAIGLVREEVTDALVEPLSLDQLLRDEVEDLAEHGHDLTVAHLDRITLALPPLATRRAIRNLLINAATHGKGGSAELIASTDEVSLIIRDKGPGIPEDLIERVFEPFFRAEPGRLQTIPGAGLGLALAAEIIERYGGRLSICNSPDGGLRQTVVFPRTP